MNDSSLQRNKMISQATEKVAGQAVKAGATIVSALIKFIQEMVRTALGK